MNKKIKSDLMLTLTAMIWGFSFVAQKSGSELIGPFAFNGIRTIIGGIVLIPAIFFLDRFRAGRNSENDNQLPENRGSRKDLITGGICCGCALFVAGSLQQIGIIYTTSGKAGFITALYVVIVPLLGLFFKKKVSPVLWLCVATSIVGLYLLCVPSGGFVLSTVNVGDILTFLCAIGYAIHILVIDHFSPKVDGVRLSCLQFFVVGILSVPSILFLDPLIPMAQIQDAVLNPTTGEVIKEAVVTVSNQCYSVASASEILQCWLPILYAGVLSCGVAYTLQIVAQADADPVIAAMIMCLESVFAVIGGMLILGETMALREVIGCIVMFAAIIAAQLPMDKLKTIRLRGD